MNTIRVKRRSDNTLVIDTSEVEGTLSFTVKKESELNKPDDTALIRKENVTITGDETIIELSAEDTDLKAGKYAYDFLIVDNEGKRSYTDMGAFEVLQTVTIGDADEED
jgi:uncharacterized protein (DUF2141 family)